MERNYKEEFISWLWGMDERIKNIEKYIQKQEDQKDIDMAIGKVKTTDDKGSKFIEETLRSLMESIKKNK